MAVDKHSGRGWLSANFNPYKRDEESLFAEVILRRQRLRHTPSVDMLVCVAGELGSVASVDLQTAAVASSVSSLDGAARVLPPTQVTEEQPSTENPALQGVTSVIADEPPEETSTAQPVQGNIDNPNRVAVAVAVANAARSAGPKTTAPFRGSKAAAAGLVANALANFSNATVAAQAAASAALLPKFDPAVMNTGPSTGDGNVPSPRDNELNTPDTDHICILRDSEERESLPSPKAKKEGKIKKRRSRPQSRRSRGRSRRRKQLKAKQPSTSRSSPDRQRGHRRRSSHSRSRGKRATRSSSSGESSHSGHVAAADANSMISKWTMAGKAPQRGPPTSNPLQVPDLLLPTGVSRACDQAKLQAAQLAAARRLQVVPVAASAVRPGDWFCPICSAHNYASKFQCFRCMKGTNPLLDGSQGMLLAANGCMRGS